jgi:hypothetical protein
MAEGDPGFVPVWMRETPCASANRDAEAFVVCFTKGALREDVKLQVDRFGVPSAESIRAVSVRQYRREENPEWFDGWRSGPVRSAMRSDLKDLGPLDAADGCYTFQVSHKEPADLGYLQAVWALVRWFFARGAVAALDAYAIRYTEPSGMPGAQEPFNIRQHVKIVFETDATHPGGGHVIHTRGMRNFGRPDVVAVCSADDGDLIGEVIWQLASSTGGRLDARAAEARRGSGR